jgi:hypothetical protein
VRELLRVPERAAAMGAAARRRVAERHSLAAAAERVREALDLAGAVHRERRR